MSRGEQDSGAHGESEPLPPPPASRRGAVWPPIFFLTKFHFTTTNAAMSGFQNPTEIERLVANVLGGIDSRLVTLYWVHTEDTLDLLAIHELPSIMAEGHIAEALEARNMFAVESSTRLRTAEGIRIGLELARRQSESSGSP